MIQPDVVILSIRVNGVKDNVVPMIDIAKERIVFTQTLTVTATVVIGDPTTLVMMPRIVN